MSKFGYIILFLGALLTLGNCDQIFAPRAASVDPLCVEVLAWTPESGTSETATVRPISCGVQQNGFLWVAAGSHQFLASEGNTNQWVFLPANDPHIVASNGQQIFDPGGVVVYLDQTGGYIYKAQTGCCSGAQPAQDMCPLPTAAANGVTSCFFRTSGDGSS